MQQSKDDFVSVQSVFFKKKKVTANLRQKLLLEALKEEAKANKAPSKPAQVKPAATKGKGLV